MSVRIKYLYFISNDLLDVTVENQTPGIYPDVVGRGGVKLIFNVYRISMLSKHKKFVVNLKQNW